MKIALIGGTGNVGRALLDELLGRGHQVVALQRNPEKLSPRHGLTVLQADAQDAGQVAAAVKGADMVVSAYNAGWTNPNIYADYIKGARAITQGTKDAGVSRLLVVGGAGSLLDEKGGQLVDHPDFPRAYYDGANAAREALRDLQTETALNWTFLSPPVGFGAPGNDARTGHYQTGSDHPLSTNGGVGTISAADLAVAVVDEVEANAHSRKRFTVAH